MPGSLLEGRDQTWLIDWEYAGIGHPLVDLAGFASNATAASRGQTRQ